MRQLDLCHLGTPPVSTAVNMAVVLMVVNIEVGRYDVRAMAKTTDPDVLLLAALADPIRMEILRELAGAPEVCACDFTDCCNVSQPTVSHHLKVLRDAGAVVSERRGSWVFYRIAPNLIERLSGIAQSLVPGGAMIQVAALGSRGRAADRSIDEVDAGQRALAHGDRGTREPRHEVREVRIVPDEHHAMDARLPAGHEGRQRLLPEVDAEAVVHLRLGADRLRDDPSGVR